MLQRTSCHLWLPCTLKQHCAQINAGPGAPHSHEHAPPTSNMFVYSGLIYHVYEHTPRGSDWVLILQVELKLNRTKHCHNRMELYCH